MLGFCAVSVRESHQSFLTPRLAENGGQCMETGTGFLFARMWCTLLARLARWPTANGETLGRRNPADTCCAIFCCLYKSAFENPWEKAREAASASDVSPCRKGGGVAPSCAVTVVLCGGRVYIFACASIHGSLKCCGCELRVGKRERGGGGNGLRVVYLVERCERQKAKNQTKKVMTRARECDLPDFVSWCLPVNPGSIGCVWSGYSFQPLSLDEVGVVMCAAVEWGKRNGVYIAGQTRACAQGSGWCVVREEPPVPRCIFVSRLSNRWVGAWPM
jgi:hypothetical protein